MNYFQITEMPKKTLMKINGITAVLNLKYPINSANVIIENNTPYFGEPFDSFKYKIYKENIVSVNEGNVVINFKTNKIGMPPLQTITVNRNLNTSFYFSHYVAPEQRYDRIVITDIFGKGSWLFNEVPLVVGQVIFYFDLVLNLKFITNQPRIQNNYSILSWNTKNALTTHAQTNTLTVNTISGGGEIKTLGFPKFIKIDETLDVCEYMIKIEKAAANATYQIEIDSQLFSGIGVDILNKIEIFERDITPLLINTSSVTLHNSYLDGNGETYLSIVITKETITVVENSITIKLKEINGSTSNVNPVLNTITLLIPITLGL